MSDKKTNFTLPKGLTGRFAVVKLWPDVKTAEDECIARLKIAAHSLGLECVEIYADGNFVTAPKNKITPKDCDFALHLHYDTPKLYDVFSFVALWNPTPFYHSFGYARTTRNLLTHDDFLSCSSPAADDHLIRSIKKTRHLSPHFKLYHSVAEIMHAPSLGEQKLFYAGINWEALNKSNKGRHGDLLKLLDKTEKLRIYGPDIFLGVKVWDGYKSYVSDIPFDGSSMMDEIAKAGISLVLSSEAHKECELMSNRLFESIAAGAVIICDENNFAKKFFGDTLLYIDTRISPQKSCEQILKHLTWIKKNSDKAIKMAQNAQKIFEQQFSLKQNLQDLYEGFLERKKSLLQRYLPPKEPNITVSLVFLLPKYSHELFEQHIKSIVAQSYSSIAVTIVSNKKDNLKNNLAVNKILKSLSVPIEILEVDFYTPAKTQRKLGQIIMEILGHIQLKDALMFIAPNEEIFSNHVEVLAGALIRSPKKNCVASPLILRNHDQFSNVIYEKINFAYFTAAEPNSFARFMFRVADVKNNIDLNITLPYLNKKALAALVGKNKIYQEPAPTVVIDLQREFPSDLLPNEQENAVIQSVFPKVFKVYTGYEMSLPADTPSSPKSESIQVAPKPEKLSSCFFKTIGKYGFFWVKNQIKTLKRDGFWSRWKAFENKLGQKLHQLQNNT